ncbi:MAG: hypothetical protein F4018_06645 [Acidobacteria bacterium]|nr:hypothetical protein [Acidobacteriota bacterium]MYK88040.1 hypothetical protein [Acidobacteriota bacterium]
MTEDDKDRLLLELVRELRTVHAEVCLLRVQRERHAQQLRGVCRRLDSVSCPLRVVDGRLVDAEGADVVFPECSDVVRVLGRLRDFESRLATVRSQLAALGVPLTAPDPGA